MSISKAQLKGTKQVFSFTLFSLLKNRANMIALVIFLIIGLLAVPAALLLGGGKIFASAPGAPAAQVQIYNETDLEIDGASLAQGNSAFASSDFEVLDDTVFSGNTKELAEDEAAAVLIREKEGGYRINLYTSADTKISSDDIECVGNPDSKRSKSSSI